MAKEIIDLSGRGGLLERYQGDLNDTSASPHLRYLGEAGQYADGFWNPFSYYGYTSPAVNTYTALTGTVSAPVVAFAFDDVGDVLYVAEEGQNILQLSDLEDTSVASFISLGAGETVKDMVRYEVNNTPALVYIRDTGESPRENTSTQSPALRFEGGMSIGFKTLDTTKGTEEHSVIITDDFGTNNKIIDDGTNHATKLAQAFTTQTNLSNIYGHAVSGVALKLRRDGSTAATIKCSIQASVARNAGDFTFEGNWATSTSYDVNDVVESTNNNDINYVCHTAHTSGASTEPGVGASWEDNWEKFGMPDGTELASGTVSYTDIPDNADLTGVGEGTDIDWLALEETVFDFGAPVSLSTGTVYWIVLEESTSTMTSSDELVWVGTQTDDYSTYNPVIALAETTFLLDDTYPAIGKYFDAGEPDWRSVSEGTDDTDGFYYKLILNRDDDWSATVANGAFSVETGLDTFLHLSENGLLYWFAGNKVHTADGSATGGTIGTVNEAVLLFPSYITFSDVAETRGRMYIGVQTSKRTSASDDTDDGKFFTSHRSGIYVWDKRSQIANGSDFIPTPGAKEIRNVFETSTGDVAALTVNSSGFCEIRELAGNQFGVVHTLEREAYPAQRRGISQAGNFVIWQGTNGIWYAYGQVAPGEALALYKIGTASGLTNFDYPGAIFVGNQDTTNNEMAVYFGWTDTGPGYNISKWYPNGEGTIDSNAQQANQGDVYTKVYQLPGLSTIQYIRGFHMPGSTSNATVAATLKCYTNQSSTPAWTKNLTFEDLARGWFEKEWNQPNVNFIQFEIEWATGITINSDIYRPIYLEVETQDEGRINT